MSTRTLIIRLIIAQAACVVGGLVFHSLYLKSALTGNFPANVLLQAGGLAALWMVGLMAVAWYLIVSSHGSQAAQKLPQGVESLRKTQALLRTQETVIFGLAKLADFRDSETGDHLERISYYSSTLASALQQHPDFCEVISPTFVRQIGVSSALHDIGKVGIADSILCKPARLTHSERERMKDHSQLGAECLREIERRLGDNSHFLRMAREIAASHHERWDGAGYPLGLSGDHIPVAARIVAVADVYDALSSKRVYKESLPHEECVALIAEEAGKQFDPRIVEAFLQSEGAFRQISRQLGARCAESAGETSEHTAESPTQSHEPWQNAPNKSRTAAPLAAPPTV